MKKITLNTKWQGKNIICAKSPELCNGCKDRFTCEEMEFTYDEYKDIKECMKERSYYRHKGAMRQK